MSIKEDIMLNWIEHELNTIIDLRKAFVESAVLVSSLLIAYGMFRWL